MKGLLRYVSLICLLTGLVLGQMGDYGDAPDGSFWWNGTATFPSYSASGGPCHTNGSNSTYWLSYPQSRPRSNSTTLEADALCADGDIDDGQPFIFVYLIGIPAPAAIVVPITTSSLHNAGKGIYVNVAIDVDNDLDWDGSPDKNWVVQNKVVYVPADTTLGFSFGWFGFGSDLLLFPLWARVTVTDTPIISVWQGQGPGGGWINGETEDWWYAFGRGGGGGGRGGNPQGKSHKVSYPVKVTVPCEQIVCFSVTVTNNGGQPLDNVNVGFSHSSGTPLPSGPTHQPPPAMGGSIAPGGSQTYVFCVTGWPCDGEQSSATYTINVSYDPDSPTSPIMVHSYDSLKFVSDENPWSGPGGVANLGANGVDDTLDSPPWTCVEGDVLDRDLVAWTGYYAAWMGGARWITGQPVINFLYMPIGATFTEYLRTPDSTFYHFNWPTSDIDNGLDSLVVMVESDNPIDMDFGGGMFTAWKWTIPIYVENINTPPVLTSTFPESIKVSVEGKSSCIDTVISATDADLSAGERDTIFIDYYLLDSDDSLYWADTANITFYDSGNGNAYFRWCPDAAEMGTYKLVTICWDYYDDPDSSISYITVAEGVGIKEQGRAGNFATLRSPGPNPFKDKTTITYEVKVPQAIKLTVYNIFGEKVATLVNDDTHPAGKFTVDFNAGDLPGGLYFGYFETGQGSSIEKMILLD